MTAMVVLFRCRIPSEWGVVILVTAELWFWEELILTETSISEVLQLMCWQVACRLVEVGIASQGLGVGCRGGRVVPRIGGTVLAHCFRLFGPDPSGSSGSLKICFGFRWLFVFQLVQLSGGIDHFARQHRLNKTIVVQCFRPYDLDQFEYAYSLICSETRFSCASLRI